MDTLIQEYSNFMNSGFMLDNNLANSCRISHNFLAVSPSSSDVSSTDVMQSSSGDSSNNNSSDETDNSLTMIKFIGDTLMDEEDLSHIPCMYYDCMALQATEKSFHDALLQNPKEHFQSTNIDNELLEHWKGGNYIDQSSSGTSSSDVDSFVNESNWTNYQSGLHFNADSSDLLQESFISVRDEFSEMANSVVEGAYQIQESFISNSQTDKLVHFQPNENSMEFSEVGTVGKRVNNHSENGSSTWGKHRREYIDAAEDRSTKVVATSEAEFPELLEMNVLLCSNFNTFPGEGLVACSSPKESSPKGAKNQAQKIEKSKQRKLKGGSKGRGTGVVLQAAVDLRSLLMQCAQAVANFDNRSADEFLKRIRQHSKPSGDATERVAHFFANALEARMSGTGTALYASSGLKKVSASEILQAYQVYVTSCPFQRMSNIYANKSIMKVTGKASTLHIIDFGILYGFQWPCLIKTLSERPGGPPKLRITGIDCPQPGFRPAERVEASGRRLAKFCNKFNIQFEYTAIAQKWETIQLKDLKIEKDEIVAVNCLYRLENVPDETVVSSSPRDTVLRLIKKINPDIFVHGITNGAYNTPFFATRFREALFHFSSLFDIFEATLAQEDPQRMLLEREMIGRKIVNVIACEDTERVERSETYKQSQSRNLRAGFTQLPLDREILSNIQGKVKRQYHKDFIVDEDGNWMLQGWKGKVIYALSCWKPTKRRSHG
ncbi:hypothetical protein LIER_00311 [Lithospermum erythrorhizon]|uniref:Uncharacterized protein n=1 Tax=Lithospermum erythrorhizon TaxID=34254 RepID=A0AAV3NGX3_LITER